MSARSAIILVIDRLGAGYLGPYGNTWLETAGFNRLASQSLLGEQMLAHSPNLAELYRAYWRGRSTSEQPSLPQLARAAGCKTVLLTDDGTLPQFAAGGDFDELQLVPPAIAALDTVAEDVAETAFIRLIEAAVAQLAAWQDSAQPQLLWIHARAMNGPWDGPLELRQQFADEDDPAPAAITVPPSELLPSDYDPDYLLSIAHAYAAQVAVIDVGLQALLAAIDELPQRDALTFAVTSPRGFPLGEHLRIGACDDALYGELLHVPCLMRFPGGEGALLRTQALLQPADLFATVIDAAEWSTSHELAQQSLLRIIRGEEATERAIAIAAASNQQVVRTAAWQLRIVESDEGDRYELFAKPDDRWEVNDVANRAPDIVQKLLAAIQQSPAERLPADLTSPWR